VDPDPELTLDRIEPLRRADLRVLAAKICIKCEDLGREFVSSFWAALGRKQAGQTGRRQRRLRLVESRP